MFVRAMSAVDVQCAGISCYESMIDERDFEEFAVTAYTDMGLNCTLGHGRGLVRASTDAPGRRLEASEQPHGGSNEPIN